MSNRPTISVVMPVYNAERFLGEAIDSILAQTFKDFEFIIIDDGSTDATPAILDKYAKRDERIRVIRRANAGLTKSLNECLSLARGEFVARMDGDDISSPDRFQLQIDYLQSHPDVVLLGGSYEYIDECGRLLRRIDQPTNDAELQQICLSGRTPICHPLAMMRRDAVVKAGGYDEQFTIAQDLDLWLRLGEIGKMACLRQVLLKYRLHEKSVSEKKQAMQIANMRLACERAWQRRGITGEFLGDRGWRASPDGASRHEFSIKYGWWAFNSGQRRTAFIYGAKAVAAMPFRADGWRLLLCALLKPAPAGEVS